MRILHVINNLDTGGAEKLIVDLLPRLVNKSVHVELLLLNGKDFPLLKKLQQNKCCYIHSLSEGSVYNPFLVFKIIPFIKNFDLIHVHLFPSFYWVAFAKILSFSKAKLIFTEHNTNNTRMNYFFYRIIDKWIYKFYYKIICITEEVKNRLLSNYNIKNSENLCVIENGIDLSEIQRAKPLSKKNIHYKLSDDDKLVIQVSGFRKQKDQLTLIRSLKILPLNVKLILVGDGVLRETCEKLVDQLDLEERIFFLGIRTDVPQLLKSSDIVVLSSKYEGLSLSSIEGMASGRPFIASNVAGLKEIVEEYGILFPLGDEIILANEIKKLLEDEEYYLKICKSCLKKAANYSIDISVIKYYNVYKNIYKLNSNLT